MEREHKTVLWIVVAAVAVCVALTVVTLVWLPNSGGDDGGPAPVDLSGRRSDGVHVGLVVLELTLLAALVGLVGFAVFQLMRRRAPKFEDLDPDEQRRREEAGRILHDL